MAGTQVAAQFLADLVAIHVGQHDVQNYHVGQSFSAKLQSLAASSSHENLISL